MQNYANSQNYPMQQAYNLEGLYTGVPTASTQTNYSAAPSTASTLMGAGSAMYGASQLAKVAKGGIIKTKKMASGGIASGVPAQKLDYMLGSLPDQQLAQKTQPPTDPQTIQAALSQQAFRQQMRAPGIGAAPAGQTSFNAASGGIVAFGAGGDAGKTQDMEDTEGGVSGQTTVPQQTDLARNYQQYEQLLGKNTAGADYLKTLQGLRGTPEQGDKQDAWRMIQAGIGMVGRSPFWQENIKGANPAIEGHMADVKERKAEETAFAKAQFDVDNMDYKDKLAIAKNASEDVNKEKDRLMHLGMSETQANATIEAARIHANATTAAAGKNMAEVDAMANHFKDAGMPDAAAYEKALSLLHPGYGASQDRSLVSLAEKAQTQFSVDAGPGGTMYKQYKEAQKNSPEAAAKFKQDYIDNFIKQGVRQPGTSSPGTGTLSKDANGNLTYTPR